MTYTPAIRRHRLTGRLIEAAHTVALFLVLWVTGVIILGGWIGVAWWLSGLVRA